MYILLFSKSPESLETNARTPWRKSKVTRRSPCKAATIKSLQGSRHTQPTRLPHEEVRKTLPNRTPPRKTSHPSPTSSPWTSRQTLNFRGSSENKRSRYMIVQRLKGLQTHSTRFLQIKNYYCFQVLIVSARV